MPHSSLACSKLAMLPYPAATQIPAPAKADYSSTHAYVAGVNNYIKHLEDQLLHLGVDIYQVGNFSKYAGKNEVYEKNWRSRRWLIAQWLHYNTELLQAQ